MDLMAPNFGASVWVFIWDSFPTEIVAWQQPSFSLCCPSFHITRLIRHASLIRHIIFHPWHLPMSQIMTNPPKKLPFPLAHRIIRAMFDFTLILHLTLKSGFLKIWQPRRTMKSSQHVSKTLWFQRKFPQWNPPSCKYWWIIQGVATHRNPVEANFCWAMAHNSSAPALPTSHPERCALIAVLKPMGFCWCFFQGNEENISHRNGKSSTQKCWLVGDIVSCQEGTFLCILQIVWLFWGWMTLNEKMEDHLRFLGLLSSKWLKQYYRSNWSYCRPATQDDKGV